MRVSIRGHIQDRNKRNEEDFEGME